MDKKELMELIDRADKAYYTNGRAIMSDKEYDELRASLEGLPEDEKVGAAPADGLPKVRHEYAALSLDKTKDREALRALFEKGAKGRPDKAAVVSWKLDGSTVVLTYDDGRLSLAATRGDGEVGSDITANARLMDGVPPRIAFDGHLVVRGEALMTFEDFEKVNEALAESGDEGYKNPRNLAAGTITLPDEGMRGRRILFRAFELVAMDGGSGGEMAYDQNSPLQFAEVREEMPPTFSGRLDLLDRLGFATVERAVVDAGAILDAVSAMEAKVAGLPYPTDGLVVALDDAAYTDGLSGTGHHPHPLRGFALKWEDEAAETRLVGIRWQASRTGRVTPVAEFEPVELEGTTVTAATLHNLSEMRRVLGERPFVGQRVSVYKANKIIPAMLPTDDRDAAGKEEVPAPAACPVCGGPLAVKVSEGGTAVLACDNPLCGAKAVGRLVHFCQRGCMDIRGISDATLEALVEAGIVREWADLFHLGDHPEIADMGGFGKRSWEKMVAAAEKARKCGFVAFVHALGIPNIGKGQAKMLKEHLVRMAADGSLEPSWPMFTELCQMAMGGYDFAAADGIGPVLAAGLTEYLAPCASDVVFGGGETELGRLCGEVSFEDEWPKAREAGQPMKSAPLVGKTFVVTGKVERFPNRDAIHAYIEAHGGKAAGSVTSATSYLVNNDPTSTSGKNKKAKALGVPIITEAELMAMAE